MHVSCMHKSNILKAQFFTKPICQTHDKHDLSGLFFPCWHLMACLHDSNSDLHARTGVGKIK
jgi:hypothetical protein